MRDSRKPRLKTPSIIAVHAAAALNINGL